MRAFTTVASLGIKVVQYPKASSDKEEEESGAYRTQVLIFLNGSALSEDFCTFSNENTHGQMVEIKKSWFLADAGSNVCIFELVKCAQEQKSSEV